MSYNRDWDAFNRDVIVEFRANGGHIPGRGDRHAHLAERP